MTGPRPGLPVPGDSGFGLHNLPFGVFSEGSGVRRVGVAFGDRVIDVSRLEVPGADHFLVGRTDKAARLVAAFAASLA